jgi:hypothetical protein
MIHKMPFRSNIAILKRAAGVLRCARLVTQITFRASGAGFGGVLREKGWMAECGEGGEKNCES